MIRTPRMQLAAAMALTIAITAGAQTAATTGAAPAAATPMAPAATPVPNPKPKVSESRAKATATSRTSPTVCAHLPPDDRAGCVAKAKPSKNAPALTTSASGAGGGSAPKP